LVVAVVIGLALALLATTPADARQESRDAYDWYDFGTYECPGGTLVDWEAGGSSILTVRLGQNGLAFAHDRWTWWATDEGPDGQTLYTTGHAQSIETKATHMTGSLYTVTLVQAGQPAVIRDADGNLVARDRGSVRTTYVFDLDAGEFVIDEASVRVNGPHPGFDTCDYFE
jgi:hypothetical protein